MNKTYALKYCPLRKMLLAVSEIAPGKNKSSLRHNKKLATLMLAGTVLSLPAEASTVRDDIPYQIYRDFAENKGPFFPGATGIKIYKKDGSLFSTFDVAPVPDWSFANHGGVSSLINPQYISTAAHTRGVWASTSLFGGSGKNPDYHRYTYSSVRYNDEAINYDYSVHRLNKLVTEVVPIPYINEKRADIPFEDASRYPIFARMGNGTQKIMDVNGTVTNVAAGRLYLTGGVFGTPDVRTSSSWDDITINYSSSSFLDYVFNMFPDKFISRGEAGDSGSSLIVWDALEKKWYLAGQFYGGSAASQRWMILSASLIQNTSDSDNLPPFVTSGSNIIAWSYDSSTASGIIAQGQQSLVMTGANGTDMNGLDHGKNITFSGDDGSIDLVDSIDQGAGAIKFKGNYTVFSQGDESWKGAGLEIDTGKTVTWQIKGVDGDSLHKIGQGTQQVILNYKPSYWDWNRAFIQVELSGFFSPLTRFLSRSQSLK